MVSPYASITLPNGLKVFSYFDKNIPAVYMSLVVRAGYRYENDQQIGYAHFLEHMLLKGTKKHPSAVEFARQIDAVGGIKNGVTSHERAWYYIYAAKKFASSMMGLLSEVIQEPLMDSVVLENEKKPILEEIDRLEFVIHEGALSSLAMREFYHEHPLGMSILDCRTTTQVATVSDLQSYRHAFYAPGRSALVVVGGVSHAELQQYALQYFGGWEGAGPSDVPIPLIPNHIPHIHIAREIPQTYIRLLFHTVAASDSITQAALRLLGTMLTAGGSSLLTEELRHKRGLVYGVASGPGMFADAGHFGIRTFSKKPKDVVEVIRDVLSSLPEQISDVTTESLKRQALGTDALYLAQHESRLDFILPRFIWFNRLVTPEEYAEQIAAVTTADLREAAATYFAKDNSLLATLGATDPGDL